MYYGLTLLVLSPSERQALLIDTREEQEHERACPLCIGRNVTTQA
jgi:hypothetical protein